ncbi:MAG: hypothetical protein MZV64_53005, partial [Ignavibacteriales bacterium]|nr:hypothetical protein [Ignavibacteriales bacterium]
MGNLNSIVALFDDPDRHRVRRARSAERTDGQDESDQDDDFRRRLPRNAAFPDGPALLGVGH